MAKHVVYVGTGAIGTEAQRQFSKAGYKTLAAVNSKTFKGADGATIDFRKRGDVQEILSHIEGACSVTRPDLAVFALPSGGKNAAETELAFLQPFFTRKIPIVNAGKAATAEYYDKVAPHLGLMGINAMVGGEVKILKELLDNLRLENGQDSVVELVINGTLSYIMSNVWTGRPLETVIGEAVVLKFAEPGINNQAPAPLSVFKGEGEGDVPKKLTIILNRVYGKLIGRVVRPSEIKVTEFRNERDIMRLTAGNVRRKLVVRISTKPLPAKVESGSPGSIEAVFGDKVFVDGGFYNIPVGSPDDLWVPNSGPGNAVHITQGRSRVLRGEGAGAIATVSTLLHDALLLCSPVELPKSPTQLAKVDATVA